MNRAQRIADFHYLKSNQDFSSFDLFDTVIGRRFITVHQVHDCASAYAVALFGQREKSAASDLTWMRFRMGGALKAAPEPSIQEARLVDVWHRILSQFHHARDPDLLQVMTDKVVRFEHELDKSNLAPIEGVVELLETLRAAGKTVIGISNMYFSVVQMSDILEQLGPLKYFDHLFVSTEMNATKQTGDMFVKVMYQLGLGAEELIHVGDNIVSEVEMATSLGINPVVLEQHESLKLETPAYGKREQMSQDLADPVKAHLYSVLFYVLDREATGIYCMARDGIVIQDFLKAWESPLRDAFLPTPGRETLFLTRALICWSNVDFSSDRLAFAVGGAFWLKEGEATRRDIAEMLGVDPVLPEAGEGKLEAATYQFKLADAFRESGLEEAIKREIIAKRRVFQSYLEGAGFYRHRAVALSDIGYSGAVGNAVNRISLQLSAEGSDKSPPSVLLHLVASGAIFSGNSRFAQPHCSFAEQVVIPFSAQPRELSYSSASFEYFFKHSTMLPVKRSTEQDGEIRPEMRLRRQQRLEQRPHRIAQIAWIAQRRPAMLPPGNLGPHRNPWLFLAKRRNERSTSASIASA